MNSNQFQPAVKKIMKSNLTPVEKQKKLTDLQKEIQTFYTANRATADKFTTQTDKDAAGLDVMKFIVKCPQILQNYSSTQATSATDLVKVPIQFCNDLDTAFNTFQKVIDEQRSKIAA